MAWSKLENPLFSGNKTRSLSQWYVFYESLGDADNPQHFRDTYKKVNSRLDSLSQRTKISNAGQFLKDVATREAIKEQQVLINGFGLQDAANFNPRDLFNNHGSNVGQILIDAFNTAMNYKAIYERNKASILQTKGKTIVGYFATYFWKYWNKKGGGSDYFATEAQKVKLSLKNESIIKAYDDIMSKAIEDCINDALTDMFTNSKDELKSDEYATAYNQFYEQIKAVGGSNFLVEAIKKDLFTDTIKNSINKEFTQKKKRNKNAIIADVIKQTKKTFNGNKGSLSGQIAEIIDMYITQSVIESSTKASKDFTAIHSGRANIRPDVVYTFNMGEMTKVIEEAVTKTANNRSEAVQRFKELDKDMSEIKQGFILYVNQKEYLTGGSRFKDGFVGGVTSVKNLNAALSVGFDGDSEFLGALYQVAEGAIGEKHKEDFEDALISQIAYILFDDYTTIGNISNGAQAIHLMLLNGIYLPLSVVYMALANAIEQSQGNRDELRKFVSVDLIAPAVLENQEGITWDAQRENAIKNTEANIKVGFLKNIQTIIAKYTT